MGNILDEVSQPIQGGRISCAYRIYKIPYERGEKAHLNLSFILQHLKIKRDLAIGEGNGATANYL